MKIKGGGCAGLCQGFNPNESKCQCYGCQKPCGGGRRACGRRDKHGGCGGCDEPPPQPPEECKTCAVNDLIFTRYRNEIYFYKITKNENGVISARGDEDDDSFEIDLHKRKITSSGPAPWGDVEFTGLHIYPNGQSCFIEATTEIIANGYELTWTCVKSTGCVRARAPVPVVEKIATISKNNESSEAYENIKETNIQIKEM